MQPKRIVCTVTNDLNYDQRMIRICTTLTEAGYDVTLVGFKRRKSKPLIDRPFKQVRLPIMVEQGKLMYAHYWFNLFFFLLFRRADVLCAIDLDTILPVYYVSRIRGLKRVHDAHEIFTDLREVITRPSVHKMWQWIAGHTIPKFPVGYTIGECYAEDFKVRYGVDYGVVRNATILRPFEIPDKPERYILYQGAVNVGRCFEQLIPAMKNVNARLIICGEGNFYAEAVALAQQHAVTDKVIFKGYVPPFDLVNYTVNAYIGITLFEDTSLSNRLSLANRFFDYMHSAVPQLCINYPEYQKVNGQFEIARLIDTADPMVISDALNIMLADDEYYNRLQQNCLRAREVYCWQEQAKTLISTYDSLWK
ncbi:MAG: glycosyltransferase [Chitinophagaceae bacterium]|nr:glycosyltransferase [Chitinophagaceae bacterium]